MVQHKSDTLAPASTSARSQALLWIHGFLAGTQHGVYSTPTWERLLVVIQATRVACSLLTTGML